MRYTRTTFWIAFTTLAGIWLAMLFFGGPDAAWDREVFAAIHGGARQRAVDWSRLFTQLGGWIPLTVIGVGAVIALAIKRKRRAALLLVMLFVGRMAVELHKLLSGTPRPPIAAEVLQDASLSFPSGHAANSMITYLAIALLLPIPQRYRPAAVIFAISLSIVIGLSRVILGVHWPSDVIGGWAFGLLWVVIFRRLASSRPDPEEAELDR